MEEDDDIDLEELDGFARHLGMDPTREQNLMWICRLALKAPVPEGWTSHEDGEGNTYFYHEERGISSWDHPSDGFFRKLYGRCKEVEEMAKSSSHAFAKTHQELNQQLEHARKKNAELQASADKVLYENGELGRRCIEMSQEVEEQKSRHSAELEALKALNIKNGAMAAEVPRMKEEIVRLRAKLQTAEIELPARQQGADGGDISSLAQELQRQLDSERQSCKSVYAELESAVQRAADLEARIAKLQIASMSDKHEINKLYMQLEQEALECDERTRKLADELNTKGAQLMELLKSTKFAEEREKKWQDEKRSMLEQTGLLRKQLQEAESKSTSLDTNRMDMHRMDLHGGDHVSRTANDLSAALDAATKEVRRLSGQLDALEKQKLDLANSEAEASLRLERLEAKLQEAHTTAQGEAERAARAEQDVVRLRRELDESLGRAKDAESKMGYLGISAKNKEEILQASLVQAKDREVKSAVQLQGEKEQRERLQSEVDALRAQTMNDQALLAEAESLKEQMVQRCKGLEEQISRTKEVLLQGALKTGSEAGGDVESRISTLISHAEQLKNALADADARQETSSKYQAAAEANLAQANMQARVKGNQIKDLEGIVAKLEASIAAERESKLRLQSQLDSERTTHVSRHANDQKEHDAIKYENGLLRSDLTDANGRIHLVEQKVKELQDQNHKLNESASKLRDTIEEMRTFKAKGEAEQRKVVASFSHEIRENTAQIASYRLENKQLKTKLAMQSSSQREHQLQQDIDRLRSELESGRKEKGQIMRELEHATAEMHSYREEHRALCERHEELKQGSANAYTKFVETEHKLESAEKKILELSERNRRLTTYLTEDGEHSMATVKTLEQEIARLGKERQELARRIASLTERAHGSDKHVVDLQREVITLRQEAKRLRAAALDAQPKGIGWNTVDANVKDGSGAEAHGDLGDIQHEHALLNKIISELRHTLRDIQPKLRELEVSNNQLQTENEVQKIQWDGQKQYWQNLLQQRARDLSTSEDKANELADEASRLNKEVGRLKNSNELLKRRLEDFQRIVQQIPKGGSSQKPPTASPAGRGSMGIRMQTPTVVYDTFRQMAQPPLPRGGLPNRGPSRVGGRGPSRSAIETRGMPTSELPDPVNLRIAIGHPGAVPAHSGMSSTASLPVQQGAPRPRSNARGGVGAASAMSRPHMGPPTTLMSPDVMEQLLGLKAVGSESAPNSRRPSPAPAPIPHPKNVDQLTASSQNAANQFEFGSTRSVEIGQGESGPSLVQAFERRSQQKRNSAPADPTGGYTFKAGLSMASNDRPSGGVREVNIQGRTPAPNPADSGNAKIQEESWNQHSGRDDDDSASIPLQGFTPVERSSMPYDLPKNRAQESNKAAHKSDNQSVVGKDSSHKMVAVMPRDARGTEGSLSDKKSSKACLIC